MRTARRALSVVTIALAMAAPAAAQEPALPTDPVAQVGERTITKGDFDHWLRNAVRSAPRGHRVDPPTFERCIAAERRRARRNDRSPARSVLRARCRSRYAAVRRQVMEFLIQAAWVETEAELQGIRVSPQRVRRVFESQRREAFPNRRAYRRFLRETGSNEADIMYRVRLDVLQGRLAERAVDSVRQPTSRQIARYLRRHPRLSEGVSNRRASERARRQIVQGRAGQALIRFIDGFQRRYHDQTSCAQAYVVRECGAALPAQSRK